MTETYNFVIPGLAATIGYATTSGGSATSVAQLKSIGGLDVQTTMWDSSGLTSTAREKVPLLVDSGDCPFTVIFNPADSTHYALAGYQQTNTLLYWTLTFPSPIGPGATAPESAITYKWAGYVSGFSIKDFYVDTGLTADYKVSITGSITYTS